MTVEELADILKRYLRSEELSFTLVGEAIDRIGASDERLSVWSHRLAALVLDAIEWSGADEKF